MQETGQINWSLHFLKLLFFFSWLFLIVPLFSVLHQRLLPMRCAFSFKHSNPLGWFLELWRVLGLRSSRPYFFHREFITRILILIFLILCTLVIAVIPISTPWSFGQELFPLHHSGEFSLYFVLSILFLIGFIYTAIGFTLKPSLLQLTSLEQFFSRQSIVIIIAFACFSLSLTSKSQNLQTIAARQTIFFLPSIPSWGILMNPLAFITASLALAFYARQWIDNEVGTPGILRNSIETQLVGTLLVTFKIARSLEFLALYAVLITMFLGGPFLMNTQIGPVWSLIIFTLKLFGLVLFVVFLCHLLPRIREEKISRLLLLIFLPLTLAGYLLSTWVLQLI
jgi:NADH:ubiquinone oxidoreductase subunit H